MSSLISQVDNTETTCQKDYQKENKMIPSSVPFWSNDPNILFNKDYIFEFFPTENMSYEQKMNAVTRLIVILTILGFIFSTRGLK